MLGKGGGEKATCSVCGRGVRTTVIREIAFVAGHKNERGNWCSGGMMAMPGRVMNSTECPGEIVERDAQGREVGRGPCNAIITLNTLVCRRCKTHFAPGSLTAFRVHAHARSGMRRSWALRFL